MSLAKQKKQRILRARLANKNKPGYLKILNFVFIYFGVGYVIQLIHHPKKDEYVGRRPSSFLFWLLGGYSLMFGIAYQRYEINLNRLHSTVGIYGEQLSDPLSVSSLNNFIALQSNEIPTEPFFFNPMSTFKSFYEKKAPEEIVNLIGDLAADNISKILSSSYQGTYSVYNFLSNSSISSDELKGQKTFQFHKSHINGLWSIYLPKRTNVNSYIFDPYLKEPIEKLPEITSFVDGNYNNFSFVNTDIMFSDVTISGELHLVNSIASNSDVLSPSNSSFDESKYGTLNVYFSILVNMNLENAYIGDAEKCIFLNCHIPSGLDSDFYKENLLIEPTFENAPDSCRRISPITLKKLIESDLTDIELMYDSLESYANWYRVGEG